MTSPAGLINQYYSHIAAFILASTTAAEIVLPPALMRSSYGNYYSRVKRRNQVIWSPVSTDLLLDVDAIQKAWEAKGIAVYKVRAHMNIISEQKTGFMHYFQGMIQKICLIHRHQP